ncbi:thioredoxin family protein [bacterium]|nr:MAG: thioredoxin family protein [bacterium]QQR61612.1 MAG: thioredoxin family protein [bacterium]QQR62827.1 MAG: thioredoxin family protein [bacterium]
MKCKLFVISVFCLHNLIGTEIRVISDQQEFETLLAYSKLPIFAVFTAPWCSICKSIKEPLKQVINSSVFKDKINFVSIDFDKNNALCSVYKVDRVPTFCYFYDGKKVRQDVGVKRNVEIKTFFETALSETFRLNDQKVISYNYETFSFKSLIARVTKPPLQALKNGIEWCLERL